MGEIKARRDDPAGKPASRRRIPSATNGDRKDLIAQRFRLNEEVIDFMERHRDLLPPRGVSSFDFSGSGEGPG